MGGPNMGWSLYPWMRISLANVTVRTLAINRFKRPEPEAPEGLIDVEEELRNWAAGLKWNEDITCQGFWKPIFSFLLRCNASISSEFMLINADGKVIFLYLDGHLK
jgi:prepilin-type processing-associated H-X9-DG protein